MNKIFHIIGAVLWSVALIALVFDAYEPSKFVIGFAFFASAMAHAGEVLKEQP